MKYFHRTHLPAEAVLQRAAEFFGERLAPVEEAPRRRRFAGTRIEHLTFFLEDPSQNLLEFKYYVYETAILGERDFLEVGDSEAQ